jgi:hypothetical protein
MKLPSLFIALGLLVIPKSQRADQIQMQNGDHYFGRVVSVSSNTVVLQSEVLGSVTLPREKIASISFVTNPPAKLVSSKPLNAAVPKPVSTATNATKDLPAQLRTSPASVKDVEEQYLAGATPEAKAKFNEMVNGLATGKLNVNDIRAQAKSAADQLRAARSELGEEAGDAIDGYLAILDSFLRDTQSGAGSPAKVPPASKPKSVAEE